MTHHGIVTVNRCRPAPYVAKLFGSDDTEGTVRSITAPLVLVLDPLAVLLTLAASWDGLI